MNDHDLRASIGFFRAQLESWPLPGLLPVLARLLAAGKPVTVADVAKAGSWTPGQVREALSRHPGTDWDAAGLVLGFGLTLRPTPHSFTFDGDGGTMYGFCASDTLAFPVILGRPGTAGSSCPVTGQPVRVRLGTERVLGIDPPGAVVSKVRRLRLSRTYAPKPARSGTSSPPPTPRPAGWRGTRTARSSRSPTTSRSPGRRWPNSAGR
jgi:alkylmercury lyase